MIVIAFVLLVAGQPEASVYAAKPWGDPVMATGAASVQSRTVGPRATSFSTVRAAQAADTTAWPDASQSVMRRFVCESRPAGLAYDTSVCGAAVTR